MRSNKSWTTRGSHWKCSPGETFGLRTPWTQGILQGDVLSLADHRRHVLLELPHELYFPLEPILDNLQRHGMQGILSHPERNAGILKRPTLLRPLVDHGCLMQVTCGSLLGTFGPASQALAETMLQDGLVHFLATDAHSPTSRRPRMRRAYDKAAAMVGRETADLLCCTNPDRVASGEAVTTHVPQAAKPAKHRTGWLGRLLAS